MDEKKTYLADSHVHLSHGLFNSSFPYFRWEGDRSVREENGTREALIDKMKEQGIRFCVEPAVELESNERLLALAERCPGYVLPAVGIHPTRTFSFDRRRREAAPQAAALEGQSPGGPLCGQREGRRHRRDRA